MDSCVFVVLSGVVLFPQRPVVTYAMGSADLGWLCYYPCHRRQGCSVMVAAQWRPWRLSPGGCAAWPIAPASPPDAHVAPSQPAEPSASVCCGPEPVLRSPGRPTHTNTIGYQKPECLPVWLPLSHLYFQEDGVWINDRVMLFMCEKTWVTQSHLFKMITCKHTRQACNFLNYRVRSTVINFYLN